MGRVEVICGGMFSGKSEELIRRLKRAQIAKQKVLCFKPAIDDRYSETSVMSHNGAEIEAVRIKGYDDFGNPEILEKIDANEVIGFDEVQFFEEDIEQIILDLKLRRKRVIVSGLDMDHKKQAFKITANLLCKADEILKLHAVCIECGKTALYSYRKSNDKIRILVGGIDTYSPLCEKCFNMQYREDELLNLNN